MVRGIGLATLGFLAALAMGCSTTNQSTEEGSSQSIVVPRKPVIEQSAPADVVKSLLERAYEKVNHYRDHMQRFVLEEGVLQRKDMPKLVLDHELVASLQPGADAHIEYLANNLNDIIRNKESLHAQVEGRPGYSSLGEDTGKRSIVLCTMEKDDLYCIDWFMSSPYHQGTLMVPHQEGFAIAQQLVETFKGTYRVTVITPKTTAKEARNDSSRALELVLTPSNGIEVSRYMASGIQTRPGLSKTDRKNAHPITLAAFYGNEELSHPSRWDVDLRRNGMPVSVYVSSPTQQLLNGAKSLRSIHIAPVSAQAGNYELTLQNMFGSTLSSTFSTR